MFHTFLYSFMHMLFIMFIVFSPRVTWFSSFSSRFHYFCHFVSSLFIMCHGFWHCFHHVSSCVHCFFTCMAFIILLHVLAVFQPKMSRVYTFVLKNISPTQAGNSLHIYQNLEHTPLLGINSPPARWGLLDFMSVACSSPPLLSSSPLLLLLLNRDPRRTVFCRTSTTTIHAQCSLPDLNHDHPRPVFPAGPQPRPSTPSVPCRTSTASIHAKCSLPDLM